jgi:two-component system, OmpR family, sensor histidine kinase BaeS
VRAGITRKILVSLVLASTLAVAITAVIMQWSIQRGFMQYINNIEHDGIPQLVRSLEQEYARTGSWQALRSDLFRWRQLTAASLHQANASELPPPPSEHPPQFPGMLPPHIAKQFDQRLFLATADKELLIGAGPLNDAILYPIQHNGAVVGYLGLLPQRQPVSAAQEQFLKQQHQTLLVAVVIVITIAILISLIVARRLVQPLTSLAGATRELALGAYHIRVPARSNDELGQLATDFNALALALEHNEEARRRWVIDISHELRTPLTFLRSQVEAILDGVREPTPETITAIHHEIIRFTRLVDDLHQLSMSDVGAQPYRKERVDISRLLQQTVTIIEPTFTKRQISLQLEVTPELSLEVFGDDERLQQLFTNLLDNSLKYTEPGGFLRITAQRHNARIQIDLQDSAPGVPEDELDRLFGRLYRADASRSRATGGSGLGLAICRNIVEAHEGSISAQLSPFGGVWIHIDLPHYRRD